MGKIACLVVILSAMSSHSFGETSRNTAKALVNKMEETKAQLASDAETQRKVLASLYTINKKMRTMAEKRSELSDKVLSAEARVKKVARSIAMTEKEVETQHENLQKRMRTLYMMNGQSLMRILFGSQSGQEFDRNLKYLKILAERDHKLISDYQHNLATLKVRKTELKRKVKRLVGNQASLKKQKKLLINQQSSKSKLLKHIRSSKTQYLTELKRLRQKGQSVRGMSKIHALEAALRPSFFEKKGRLPLPVAGRITQGFGIEQDPTYGFQYAHKGVKIQAGPGSTVKSVFPGKVAFEGFLRGYGASIIIDHGDHFYSVYGNAESTFVSKGEEVKAGQEIALAVPSASSHKSNVYFEIRHFSEALDPSEWVKASNLRQTQL